MKPKKKTLCISLLLSYIYIYKVGQKQIWKIGQKKMENRHLYRVAGIPDVHAAISKFFAYMYICSCFFCLYVYMLVFFAYMYTCHAAIFKYFAYICIYVSVCGNTCHFERSNEKTKELNPKPKNGITCHGEIIYIYIGI